MFLRLPALVAAIALLAPLPALAAAEDLAALTPIRLLIERINADDVRGVARAFTSSPTIVDEFPPFAWTGTGAPERWGRAFGTMAAAQKISAFHGTLGTATAWERSGDGGYLVVPVTFTFHQGANALTETGLWAFTLRRASGAWKIVTSSCDAQYRSGGKINATALG